PAKPAPSSTPAPTTPAMLDDEVIQKIVESAQAAKFLRLMAGQIDGYPGESEADMALAGVLAFWTQDPEQIDRLMRRSKLERGKWDEHRPGGTYLSTTIDKVLENLTAGYGAKPGRESRPLD